MPDGVKLSVTYFKPLGTRPNERFPVLLELLPYRKDDSFYLRDYPLHHWFAAHGYVSAKVDLRGTGSSEGKVPDREYSDAEIADAVAIIAALARAPWSNGRVGMWGISWGGFNALITAMQRPPALRAVLALHASDDLFHDDVHYIDGALHIDPYILQIDHQLGLPRSPDYKLDRRWLRDRFEAAPWVITYLKRQHDSDWWRSRSWRHRRGTIDVPVYLIGGLLDGYRDTVWRAMLRRENALQAQLGPWTHDWPDNGTPGPHYEWRQEALRWWDRWLRAEQHSTAAGFPFRFFQRTGHAPGEDAEVTPGFWAETSAALETEQRTFALAPQQLLPETETPRDRSTEQRTVVPSVGTASGLWWGELTGDHAADDRGCFVYDSAPLERELTLAGMPEAALELASDQPSGFVSVRLLDRLPDGSVALVTGAVKPLTQRDSRLEPEPFPTDRFETIRFPLHFTTWSFRAGHQIRLTVCGAQFPMIWPTASRPVLQLRYGRDSQLMLPSLHYDREPTLLEPEPRAQRPDAAWLPAPEPAEEPTIGCDLITGRAFYQSATSSAWRIGATRYAARERYRWEVDDDDPATASFEGRLSDEVSRQAGSFELVTLLSIRSDRERFHVTFTRQLWRGKQKSHERVWKESVPRGWH
jgi:hypothetical protein